MDTECLHAESMILNIDLFPDVDSVDMTASDGYKTAGTSPATTSPVVEDDDFFDNSATLCTLDISSDTESIDSASEYLEINKSEPTYTNVTGSCVGGECHEEGLGDYLEKSQEFISKESRTKGSLLLGDIKLNPVTSEHWDSIGGYKEKKKPLVKMKKC